MHMGMWSHTSVEPHACMCGRGALSCCARTIIRRRLTIVSLRESSLVESRLSVSGELYHGVAASEAARMLHRLLPVSAPTSSEWSS